MTTSSKTRFTSIIAAGLIAAALVPASAAAFTETGTESGGGIALAKQASEADPFVADVSPEATAPAAIGDDGFEWGDALIGAGAMLAAVAVVLAASGVLRTGRKRYPVPARGAASQGV
jgi:hypothetical protein